MTYTFALFLHVSNQKKEKGKEGGILFSKAYSDEDCDVISKNVHSNYYSNYSPTTAGGCLGKE